MHPLRLSLFALLLLAVLGLSQEAEADDWEPTFEIVGSYDTDGHAKGITISGNYAYISEGTAKLEIFNIGNPTNPILVGNYDIDGNARRVTISGNYAYVANNDGLVVLNVEDPSNTTLVGSYDTVGNAWDVTTSGNYAYVADRDYGLIILNIDDPSNITLVGSYETQGQVRGVTISGNYAYIADYYKGLFILDIENPSNVTLIGSYDDSGNAQDVTILGNYAYIADEYDGLVILNITNLSNPTLVGSYDVIEGSTQDITISGNYAYLANTHRLILLNITDPANPTLEGSYDDIDNVQDVTISGDYAYLADWGHGLKILEFAYTPLAVIDSIYPSPARFDDEISFSGSGEDYDGTIVAYEWTNEGDLWSDEEDFSVTGLSAGTYNILFRVQDNSIRWSDYDRTTLVVYPNSPPIEVIDSISPSSAEKGTTVFFNGTGTDSDGTVASYLWESSIDGELSTEEDFSSNNLSPGRHVITFKVQDNDGASNTASQELWIYASPVAIAGQNATGTPGVPIQFSGAGTDEDGTIAKYEWDFDGDGIFEWSSTENGRELNIYNNEGTYTATLRVTDNDGFTATDTVVAIISEKTIQLDDDGNVVVEDADENEEGIPGFGFAAAILSVGLIARFRRR